MTQREREWQGGAPTVTIVPGAAPSLRPDRNVGLPLLAQALAESSEKSAPTETTRPGGLAISTGRPAPSPFYFIAKRTVDILGALLGLILLSPLILCLMVLIGLDSRGPIFHRRRVLGKQVHREGVQPRTFDAFKFRTMVPNADSVLMSNPELYQEYQKDFKLRHDPRITRIGHYLRPMSLDEIPQLLNVLRGQMTLVGPRMISPPELTLYGSRAAKLLTVKPGLTGLWQVSGRQTVGYAERIRLDMWYIDHRSSRLDLEIMMRTIGTVLSRRGAF